MHAHRRLEQRNMDSCMKTQSTRLVRSNGSKRLVRSNGSRSDSIAQTYCILHQVWNWLVCDSNLYSSAGANTTWMHGNTHTLCVLLCSHLRLRELQALRPLRLCCCARCCCWPRLLLCPPCYSYAAKVFVAAGVLLQQLDFARHLRPAEDCCVLLQLLPCGCSLLFAALQLPPGCFQLLLTALLLLCCLQCCSAAACCCLLM